MKKKIEETLDKIGTIENNKAFGELLVQLIESNISVSNKINELTDSISKSSEQSANTNKRIVFLTIIIAFSALISACYYLYLVLK